jgi:hypothetical protein
MKKLVPALLAAAAIILGGCRDAARTADAAAPAGTSADSVTVGDPAFIDSAGVVAASDVRALTPSQVAGRAPAQIRGIYLNAYAAGGSRINGLLELAANTEINTFVIDVKDERGIRYRSEVALAMELAQPGEVTIRDLSALATRLREAGVWSMARIVLFKDPILSKARPQWSIRKPDGSVWVDREGNTWVSAWDPEVWDYNLDIAEEVARAGFDEIQFDYVRFPEAYRSLPEQVHPKARGTRSDAIALFLDEARRRLHPLGVVVAADVFGLSPNDPRDVAIGQNWETVLSRADHVLPMVYPSHYFPTHLRGVSRPNRMPYETVFTSVGLGMIRWERLRDAGVKPARVIPWLQAFNAPWVDRNFPYGPEQADAQIRAVYDVGLEDWVFWHPGSRYDQVSAAFAKETVSRAKQFTPSADFVSQIDALERQGVREARDAASGRTPPAAAPAATGTSGTTGTTPE